ncbi:MULTISPECIES: threonine-phosphate decarboxylase [Falsihalocynthiibacter]|uniref:threonine-phosphate decarboxylase n=1 Tax=Falsihalocynthiibacter TaxID=2854182 RepID=UPI0030024694
MKTQRDHGGGIDAAMEQFGGTRGDWLDLSTGINPVPFPLPSFPANAWMSLPDHSAFAALEKAARAFWNVPDSAAVLAAPGASALIARIPHLSVKKGAVRIIQKTYNEHAAAFRTAGWNIEEDGIDASVTVHPNNPTGAFTASLPHTPLTIIDESFCDVAPAQSHIAKACEPGTLILKSFGKFWGLAGLRLGFVIGDPGLINELRETLGPWQISGPAITTGIAALADFDWAEKTRSRLAQDAGRMNALLQTAGAESVAGTTLFQLYHVGDAQKWFEKLAHNHVLSRIFPYSNHWLRLGMPAPNQWDQLESAL